MRFVLLFLFCVGFITYERSEPSPVNFITLSNGSVVWSRVYIELKPGETYFHDVAKVKS